MPFGFMPLAVHGVATASRPGLSETERRVPYFRSEIMTVTELVCV